MVSQPVRAWKAGNAFRTLLLRFWQTSWTGTKRRRSLTPVRNHSSLDAMSSKWAALKTSTSVSGDCITIFASWHWPAAYFAWSSILVSASSWLDFRSSTSTHESLVMATHLSPSLNPPPMTSWVLSRRCLCPRLHMEWVRKSHKFFLLFGLEIYLSHCLGTGVAGPPMYTSSALDEPLLVRSPALMESSRYWSKTTWTQ